MKNRWSFRTIEREEKFPPSNNCDVEKLGTKSHAFPLPVANIFLSVIGIELLPFYFTNDRNFPLCRICTRVQKKIQSPYILHLIKFYREWK